MALSKSRLAYKDCYKVLDRALEDPTGIRVRVESTEMGVYFRMRLHQARSIDRDDNRKTYEPGDPMYNRSAYDVLVCRMPVQDKDGRVWVEINKPEANLFEIESLTDGGPIEDEPTPESGLAEDDDVAVAEPEIETMKRRI